MNLTSRSSPRETLDRSSTAAAQPVAHSSAQPPFGRESTGIVIQQLPRIDPIPNKGPATEVMDEQVMGDGQLKSRPPRPFSEVIIVEEPQSEALRQVRQPYHEQPASRADRTPTVWGQ